MTRFAKTTSAALGLVCFVAAACAVWIGLDRLYDAQGLAEKGSGLTMAMNLEKIGNRLRRERNDPDAHRVVILGDSMMKRWKRGKPDHTVPKKLSSRLKRLQNKDRPIYVVPFTLAGLGVDEEYALVDEVLQLEPDLVLLQFNLKRLSAIVRSEWKREKLVGFIRPHRLPRALTLDLFGRELTVDELLFRVALVQVGGARMWERVSTAQGRTEIAYRDASKWLDWNYGSKRVKGYQFSRGLRAAGRRTSTNNRPNAQVIRNTYGPALRGVEPDHSVVEVLAAAVEAFRAEGVEVLVFVSPANVEHFERLGLADPERLQHTIDSLRVSVEGAGGRFADFHDLVPDNGFRDTSGHLSVEGNPDPHTRLGAKLALEVMTSLGETPRAR